MAFLLVICLSINYTLSSRLFDQEENAFIVDYKHVNKNGLFACKDTRMANPCPDVSTGHAGAIYDPRRLVACMFTGHRRPSTTKRAGCGQGPRAPGKGPGALPLPSGTGKNGAGLKKVGTPAPSE